MSPEQMQAFRAKLAENRQPVTRAEQYAHPRGWNDCLDAVERWLKQIVDTPEDGT